MKLYCFALVLFVGSLSGCQDRVVDVVQTTQTPQTLPTREPKPTKPPIPEELLRASPEQLCAKLKDIKTLPTFEPTPTDPIYEALVLKDDTAIPCLIENIADRREVPDPRYSVPVWQHFAVGDTALFTLLDILSKDDGHDWERRLLESLPEKSRQEWDSNGIYAYFNYVSEPKNRKDLQRWWKNWIKQNNK